MKVISFAFSKNSKYHNKKKALTDFKEVNQYSCI